MFFAPFSRGRKRRGHGPNDCPQTIKIGGKLQKSPKSENSRIPKKNPLRPQHLGASVVCSCSHFGAPDWGPGVWKSVSVHCQPIMSTGDWELFRARGKQRRFSPVAAARHSKAARAYMDGRFRESNGYHVQVFIRSPGTAAKHRKNTLFPQKFGLSLFENDKKGKIRKKKRFQPKIRFITLDSG